MKEPNEINGTLTPKGARNALVGLFFVLIVFGAVVVHVVNGINDMHKDSAEQIAKMEAFNLAYGRCSALAQHKTRYPSSFKIDDPQIIEARQEFEKGNGIDIAFTAKNAYGMEIAGTGHCLVNGTLDSLSTESD
jgi:hypothetical protein